MSLPPLAIAAFWIAVILGLTAAFFVFAHKWRERRARSGEPKASDLLAEFLQLRSRGEISDEEYQRIKERLGVEMERELTEDGAVAHDAGAVRALKQTARLLLAGHNTDQKTAPAKPELSARAGEPETNGAAGGSAGEGCDAAPPSGGDSTEERR